MVLVSLPYRKPENSTQAQFCLPFAFAASLLWGGPKPCDLTEETWQKSATRDLMAKVTLQEDESGELAALGHETAEVTLRLVDGRSFQARRVVAPGDPRDPLTADAMAAKFRANTVGLLGEEASTRLLDLLGGLENLSDLSEFSSLAAGPDAMIAAAPTGQDGKGAHS
jgi:2-methylcitrate dehydratase PrpD